MSTRCDCAPEEVEGALPDYEACPELALAALITLMTSFPSRRSPAIARSAALGDPDCSRQWELPISVATSFEWEEDDRVAWVRALQVDERLTVVAAAPDAGLAVGDKIVEIQGYKKKDSNKMLAELASLRDDGDRFR